MHYLLIFTLNLMVWGAIFLGLKRFFPNVYAKLMNLYLISFSYIKALYRTIIAFNSKLLNSIKNEYQTGYKVFAIIQFLCYIVFLLIQVLIGLAVAASYLVCRLTGVCPI